MFKQRKLPGAGGNCLVNKSVLMFHLDLIKERQVSHKKNQVSLLFNRTHNDLIKHLTLKSLSDDSAVVSYIIGILCCQLCVWHGHKGALYSAVQCTVSKRGGSSKLMNLLMEKLLKEAVIHGQGYWWTSQRKSIPKVFSPESKGKMKTCRTSITSHIHWILFKYTF